VVAWPWPGANGSTLGLAASEARVGADYRSLQRRTGSDPARYERNVELTWRVSIGDHVVLQPDVQYIVNPGAERRIPNAWVVGVRVELAVSR
jgi:porin